MKTSFTMALFLMAFSVHAQKAELTVIDPDIKAKSLEKNFNVRNVDDLPDDIPEEKKKPDLKQMKDEEKK